LFGGPVFACGLHGEDWAWEKSTLGVPEGVHKPITYEKKNMFTFVFCFGFRLF
jgi:hypothetical protein